MQTQAPDRFNVDDVQAFLDKLPRDGSEMDYSPAASLVQAMHESYEASMNAAMGVKGWSLRDIPYCLDFYWDKLISWIGAENIKIVSLNSRRHLKVTSRRGTLLIAPEGMQRLNSYVQKQEKEGPVKTEPYRPATD